MHLGGNRLWVPQELHISIDLFCGTTAAELHNSVDLLCGTTADSVDLLCVAQRQPRYTTRQISFVWHNSRRATQLVRFTSWHNGRRATKQLGRFTLCGTTASELLLNSVGTTAANVHKTVDFLCVAPQPPSYQLSELCRFTLWHNGLRELLHNSQDLLRVAQRPPSYTTQWTYFVEQRPPSYTTQ